MKLAKRLIDDLTQKKFDPAQYHDTYRERVVEAAQQKAAGEEVTAAPTAPQRGQVIDLMAALKASLEKRGAAKEKAVESEPEPSEKKVAVNAQGKSRAAAGSSSHPKARRVARKK
jgi:DNA end-binding protein Ku